MVDILITGIILTVVLAAMTVYLFKKAKNLGVIGLIVTLVFAGIVIYLKWFYLA